jgi:hypothetical protein
MDAAQFRTDFPEFADTSKYADAQVDMWLTVAGLSLPTDRWGALLDLGTELFIAHHLVIGARDAKASSNGIPGQTGGAMASKSVDKVSISYDTTASTIEGGDFWNSSTYGIRFLRLARMMGAGGVQL